MQQPSGFCDNSNKVCKLNKAIYGLHQSSRNWFYEMDDVLINLNFRKLDFCNCVYLYEEKIVLLLYVDDIVLFAKNEKDLEFGINLLSARFDLKVLGETRKLLGIEFEKVGNKLFIHQSSYIEKICKMYDKFKYSVSSLPIPKGLVLSKKDSPGTIEEINEMSKFPYRNLIGCLNFIAGRTRPDIMYSVNILSQFQSNPGVKHWNCLLKLLGYLRYTKDYKLELSKVETLNLKCYSDSDFASNRDDRISMGGYIVFLDNTPISWKSFKQKCVSLSTMEAEFVTLTESSKELIWLKNVLENKCLNLNLKDCTLYCDNQASINFANSPLENQRTKHIDVRYHFIRNLIYDTVFKLKYVKSELNMADIFTKPLTRDQLLKFCRNVFKF